MQIVTSSCYRITKDLGGRKYTLRALTFGEWGALVDSAGPHLRPTPAVVMEETREALRRAGREDKVLAVDEFEAAEDSLRSLVMQSQGDETGGQQELREARTRLAAARRALDRAEWLVREDAALADMRALARRMDRQEHLSMLQRALVSWEGEGLPTVPEQMTAEFIDRELPSGDVSALGMAVMQLVQPTREVEGN